MSIWASPSATTDFTFNNNETLTFKVNVGELESYVNEKINGITFYILEDEWTAGTNLTYNNANFPSSKIVYTVNYPNLLGKTRDGEPLNLTPGIATTSQVGFNLSSSVLNNGYIFTEGQKYSVVVFYQRIGLVGTTWEDGLTNEPYVSLYQSGSSRFINAKFPDPTPIIVTLAPVNYEIIPTTESCSIKWKIADNQPAYYRYRYCKYGASPSAWYYQNVSSAQVDQLSPEHALVLSGLDDDQKYKIEVANINGRVVSDTSNLPAESWPTADTKYFTTKAALADPTFSTSTPTETFIGSNTATINVKTNVDTIAHLEYGLTTNLGLDAWSFSFKKDHNLVLTDLSDTTTYYYRITITNVAETITVSPTVGSQPNDVWAFTTIDEVPPKISNIRESLSSLGTIAAVKWDTNESANSLVEYGTTTAYGSSVNSASLTRSHSLSLTSLTAGQLYYYKITSVDGSTNSSSAYGDFITTDSRVPTIYDAEIYNITATTASIRMTQPSGDVYSRPLLKWGTSAISENSKIFDAVNNNNHDVTLTGLTAGTTYKLGLFLKSANTQVDSAQFNSTDIEFTTPANLEYYDQSCTMIAGGATGTAVLHWKTNTPTNYIITYAVGYPLTGSSVNTSFGTTHDVEITGLTYASLVTFRVVSTSAAPENIVWEFTREVNDRRIPNIQNIFLETNETDSAGNTSTKINWDTQTPATCTFEYSLYSNFSTILGTVSTSIGTSHTSSTITGLVPSTNYYYRIRGTNAATVVGAYYSGSFSTRANTKFNLITEPSQDGLHYSFVDGSVTFSLQGLDTLDLPRNVEKIQWVLSETSGHNLNRDQRFGTFFDDSVFDNLSDTFETNPVPYSFFNENGLLNKQLAIRAEVVLDQSEGKIANVAVGERMFFVDAVAPTAPKILSPTASYKVSVKAPTKFVQIDLNGNAAADISAVKLRYYKGSSSYSTQEFSFNGNLVFDWIDNSKTLDPTQNYFVEATLINKYANESPVSNRVSFEAIAQQPKPSLYSPRNGMGSVNPSGISFTGSACANISRTEWILTTDASFQSIFVDTDETGGNDNISMITYGTNKWSSIQNYYTILNNTTYYVKLRYYVNGMWSLWSDIQTFTTKALTPPKIIELNARESNTNKHYFQLTVQELWPGSNYGTYSNIQYKLTSDSGGSTVLWSTTNSAHSVHTNVQLADYTTYYVWARWGNTQGTYSEWANISVTTGLASPNTPVNEDPYNTETEVDPRSFTLRTEDHPGAAYLTSAIFQISQYEDFSSLKFNSSAYIAKSGSAYYSKTTGNTCVKNGTYYWRCKVQNATGWSSWSNPTKFYTIKAVYPDTPSITSPSTTTTGVSLTPTITASSYNSFDSATHLLTDWIIRADDGRLLWSSFGESATTSTTGALSSFDYEWVNIKVRYSNGDGYSNWSTASRVRTIPVVPQTPTIIYPTNSEIDIDFPFTLVGSGYDSDVDHPHLLSDWVIASDSGFSSVVFTSTNDATNLGSILVSSGLSRSTLYYVKVRYQNSIGWSSWSTTQTFTTIINVPTTPTLTSPTNALTNVDMIPTLTSSIYAGEGTHLTSHYEIALDSSFDNIVFDYESSSAITSFELNENIGTWSDIHFEESGKLNSYTTYYWRVAYTNKGGESATSTVFSFVTLVMPADQPEILTPEDSSRKISKSDPVITGTEYEYRSTHLLSDWEIRDTDDIDSLDNIIWEDSDSTELESVELSDGTFTANSLESIDSELLYNKTYFIRVRYNNASLLNGGWSEWSELNTFNSEVRDASQPIILNTETDDVINTDFNILGSEWAAGEYGIHLNTRYQISTDNLFIDNIIIDEVLYNTEVEDLENIIITETLDKFTYYYLRIIHANENGDSSWSDTFTFRTIVYAPQTPTNVSPIDNTEDLDWEAVIILTSSGYDATENPQVKAHLSTTWEVARTGTFTDSDIIWKSEDDASNLMTIGIPGESLDTNRGYYWRIRHSNVGGFSEYSEPFYFTVLPDYPQKPSVLFPLDATDMFPKSSGIFKGSKYVGEGTHAQSDWDIQTLNASSTSESIWEIESDYSTDSRYLEQVLVNNIYGVFINKLAGRIGLTYYTEYDFRIRYKNEKGWSDWSDTVSTYSEIDEPNIPYCVSPGQSPEITIDKLDEDSLNVEINPELVASEYSGEGSFVASSFQVALDSDFTQIVWEGANVKTAIKTDNLNKIIVNKVNGLFTYDDTLLDNSTSLDYNVVYYWRASYKNEVGYSQFSQPFEFKVKRYVSEVRTSADIDKKLVHLVDRFVTKTIQNRHPKFKQFFEHYLKFMDTNSNQFLFNLTDFNTIKDFYTLVEPFDWADDVKLSRFKNFIDDDSLQSLLNIYFGSEINPEILRFFRSLNTRKGSSLSFQILMKLLGYEITVENVTPYVYKITSTDGKINSVEEIAKFVEAINLFHPAGTKYSMDTEISFDVLSIDPTSINNEDFHFCFELFGTILKDSDVTESEIISILDTRFMMWSKRYMDIDNFKLENKYGYAPYDLETTQINDFLDTTIKQTAFHVQREVNIEEIPAP